MAGAMRWVADRHLKKPLQPGCTNVTESAESALGARQGITFRGLFDVALGAFGLPVGPSWMTNFMSKFPQRVVIPADADA
jgi:hypothetical protein